MVIRKLIADKAIRKNINKLLLKLELIHKPLNYLDLVKLAAYDITLFELPFVKGAIMGAQGLTLIFVTKKIKQVIVSKLSGEIACTLYFVFVR